MSAQNSAGSNALMRTEPRVSTPLSPARADCTGRACAQLSRAYCSHSKLRTATAALDDDLTDRLQGENSQELKHRAKKLRKQNKNKKQGLAHLSLLNVSVRLLKVVEGVVARCDAGVEPPILHHPKHLPDAKHYKQTQRHLILSVGFPLAFVPSLSWQMVVFPYRVKEN